MSSDFIFRGTVNDLDPALQDLLNREAQRQQETIILIPSESMAPNAVNEALGSAFSNIYAEGYPNESSRKQSEAEILDYDNELASYRRNSDPRYYKGVEYADLLEALTRRRAAELFAANGVSPDSMYINVQPLSGGPANSAVYTALLKPGDTIMGLNLNDGGHLSHGASVNRSGQVYKSVPYFVDKETERLDFEAIEAKALETKPHIMVAGFSAYPLIVDWTKFRAIADKVGAYLLADISHISGLVASGEHPSPIGIADVVMTTTHKSLCGPRGAMIMTHRKDLAPKIDRAVFPGEQGGPHLNTMGALALALKLANSEQFRQLQKRIRHNAKRLSEKLQEGGLRLVAGVSETHLLMIDAKSIHNEDSHLTGDMAARILDVAGIVTNRNTIPSDHSALSATGIRMGTVWISQLGFGDAEIDKLAEAIVTVLKGCHPFKFTGTGSIRRRRARVEWPALQRARALVRELTHTPASKPAGKTVSIEGRKATRFLNLALSSDVLTLKRGETQATQLYLPEQVIVATLHRPQSDTYHLYCLGEEQAQLACTYLQDLSDGYVLVSDPHAKLPGHVVVKMLNMRDAPTLTKIQPVTNKPFYVGCDREKAKEALPAFSWTEPTDAPLRQTNLWQTHKDLGAKMVPFGGWDMPVWYTSVSEEHEAVRKTAGLFDVSHMGVLEASGKHAKSFLDTVTANEVAGLKVGRSQYTYLLMPDGTVIDDLLIYRRAEDVYMLVVNASNNDKDWAWLNAVNNKEVMIDENRPWGTVQHSCTLRDLRDPQWGTECLVDIALQGPKSKDILLAMCTDENLAKTIQKLPWSGLTAGTLAGYYVVISRTGYTGERVAYELFVHPDQVVGFWQAIMDAGQAFNLKPCGLAARDSTRTEAGLPLYGHELAGPMNLTPGDAGFASFPKLWKPFFVGRSAFIASEAQRTQKLVRFRMDDKGVRRPEQGDPIVDRRGKVIGFVTSCAIDVDGYLLGQAMVPTELGKVGTQLLIYQTGGGSRELRLPKSLKAGARMPKPDTATVLTRFPK